MNVKVEPNEEPLPAGPAANSTGAADATEGEEEAVSLQDVYGWKPDEGAAKLLGLKLHEMLSSSSDALALGLQPHGWENASACFLRSFQFKLQALIHDIAFLQKPCGLDVITVDNNEFKYVGKDNKVKVEMVFAGEVSMTPTPPAWKLMRAFGVDFYVSRGSNHL